MNKELVSGLAWGGAIVGLALGGTWAHRHGFMDADLVTRLVIGVLGLQIAWSGNRIPKTFAPSADARSAQRVAGWSLVLSGLAYTGLFAFAPLPVAIWGGAGAVLAGVAVTFGYCLLLHARAKA
jgi:hypothetical protein